MGMVAVGVAQRVLHVADQGVEPVDDVERTIRSELERDRAEVGVGRTQERLDRRAGESRTVFLDPIAENPLKADVVVQEIVALRVVGEVPAVDQLAAAGRPPLHREKLLHAAVLLGVDDLTGKGRAEVVGAAGGVGHEVLAPAVEVVAPGIGEPVRHEDVKLPALGLPAEDARLVAPARSIRRLDLRVVKCPLLPVQARRRGPR